VRGTTVRWLVRRAASTAFTVHADMPLIRSKVKVKVKVTGLLNFRKLAKLCMHAGGDDRQPLRGTFWFVFSVFVTFWATVCKTVRPMLSDRLLSVLSCLSD